jgi:hypothetical protein
MKMKSIRPITLNFTSLLAAVFCIVLATAPRALASAEDQIDNGLTASKAWVSQIDAGHYEDSYSSGSGALHDKVPEDRWSAVLRAIRNPWGPVVSRTQTSHVYKPDGYEGTEGEFLVITYDTSFQKLSSAKEIVVLKWEDGKWLGAGYNAGGKSSPDEVAEPGPSSTTEIHTENHVQAQPQ